MLTAQIVHRDISPHGWPRVYYAVPGARTGAEAREIVRLRLLAQGRHTAHLRLGIIRVGYDHWHIRATWRDPWYRGLRLRWIGHDRDPALPRAGGRRHGLGAYRPPAKEAGK